MAGGGRLEWGLYVKTSQSDLIFQKLSDDREVIDAELHLPEEVNWDPNPERLACRIGGHRPASLSDRNALPEHYECLKEQGGEIQGSVRKPREGDGTP